jgi:pyruvate carboxylase
LLSVGPIDEKGNRTVFFKLNGQTRNVDVRDRAVKVEQKEHKKVDKNNEKQIGAPLQGMLSKVMVKKGDQVKKNQQLFIIEAMKMETIITAPEDGSIYQIELAGGTLVNTGDLVLEMD